MDNNNIKTESVFVRDALSPRSRTMIEAYSGAEGVFVQARLVRMMKGHGNAAIMLAQFIYWANRTRDPGGWFYNTQYDYEQQTGVDEDSQLNSRRTMLAMGLIEEVKMGLPCRLFIRLNFTRLEEVLIATPGSNFRGMKGADGGLEASGASPGGSRGQAPGVPGDIPYISKTTSDILLPAAKKARKSRAKPEAEKAPQSVKVSGEDRAAVWDVVVFWHCGGNPPADSEKEMIGKCVKTILSDFGNDVQMILAAHRALSSDSFAVANNRKTGLFKLPGWIKAATPKSYATQNPQNSQEGPSRALQLKEAALRKSWEKEKGNFGANITLASLQTMNFTRAKVALWKEIPDLWAEIEAFFAAREA